VENQNEEARKRVEESKKRLRDAGFEHDFVFFGHGWGHCGVCHSTVEVQYPEEIDKKCSGPRPKRLIITGLEYDCCSRLTKEDCEKIDAMKKKTVEEINERIEKERENK